MFFYVDAFVMFFPIDILLRVERMNMTLWNRCTQYQLVENNLEVNLSIVTCAWGLLRNLNSSGHTDGLSKINLKKERKLYMKCRAQTTGCSLSSWFLRLIGKISYIHFWYFVQVDVLSKRAPKSSQPRSFAESVRKQACAPRDTTMDIKSVNIFLL